MTVPPPMEFHLPVVTSTNDYAKELLGVYPYVFVSALHQTEGRGRKGRSWYGNFGANVYSSVGIKHSREHTSKELSIYMAKGALAAMAVVKHSLPKQKVLLKYPNDVMIKSSGELLKVAGVLVEHEFRGAFCESTIVGIGINIDQIEFPDTITHPCTSLRLLGANANLHDTIQMVRQEFSKFHDMPTDELFETWLKELNIIGRRIRVYSEVGVWTVISVLPDCRLVARNIESQIERTISDADTIRYED